MHFLDIEQEGEERTSSVEDDPTDRYRGDADYSSAQAPQGSFSFFRKAFFGGNSLCDFYPALRRLAKLLRYEYTSEGIRVLVHGVDHEFDIISSTDDIHAKTSDYSATQIQAMIRGFLARKSFSNIQGSASRAERDTEVPTSLLQ